MNNFTVYLREQVADGEARGKAEGKAEGLAEGEAKGKAEAMLEAARKMHSLGMPWEAITEATGVREEDMG